MMRNGRPRHPDIGDVAHARLPALVRGDQREQPQPHRITERLEHRRGALGLLRGQRTLGQRRAAGHRVWLQQGQRLRVRHTPMLTYVESTPPVLGGGAPGGTVTVIGAAHRASAAPDRGLDGGRAPPGRNPCTEQRPRESPRPYLGGATAASTSCNVLALTSPVSSRTSMWSSTVWLACR